VRTLNLDAICNKTLGNEETVTRVYWTGLTKSGCVGQYSNCFEEEADLRDVFDFEVVTNKGGGACVAVSSSFNGLMAKALPCNSLVFLGCQSYEGGARETPEVSLFVHISYWFVIFVLMIDRLPTEG